MCVVKQPKVVAASTPADAPVLRNPFLDGVNPLLRSQASGMRSLRVDRSARVATPRSLQVTPAASTPAAAGQQASQAYSNTVGGVLGQTVSRMT